MLDNSMDEAVAGHANRIEVELHADHSITIRDNGRGIPIDPHPKFPDKSALEVILCTLHAGGKFSGKAYATSGGLHGVGASVVNALSDTMRVEVARNRELFAQELRARHAARPGGEGWPRPQPARHLDHLPPGCRDFRHAEIPPRAAADHGAVQGLPVLGRRNPLEIGHRGWRHPHGSHLPFPGGLADYLNEQLSGSVTYSDKPFAGKVSFQDKFNQPGSVEWAINWTPQRDGFVQSYCNTVPTPEGGTHEAGLLGRGAEGHPRLWRVGQQQESRPDHARGHGGRRLRAGVLLHPRTRIRGPDQGPLATTEAARMVEGAVRDHFDNWLAADPKSAGAILDFLVLRAEERLKRRQEKETSRKIRDQKLRLPGKLVDCTATNKIGTELFIVEGDSAGGSAKMGRERKTQALLPLRGKILNVLGAASNKLTTNAEINDLCQALGVGLGPKFRLDDLRYDRIIIMTDADVDGAHIAALLMTFFYTQMRPMIDAGHLYLACPPLFRLTQGAKRVYALGRGRERPALCRGAGRQRQDRRVALQGLGRDGREGFEGNDDGPGVAG